MSCVARKMSGIAISGPIRLWSWVMIIWRISITCIAIWCLLVREVSFRWLLMGDFGVGTVMYLIGGHRIIGTSSRNIGDCVRKTIGGWWNLISTLTSRWYRLLRNWQRSMERSMMHCSLPKRIISTVYNGERTNAIWGTILLLLHR